MQQRTERVAALIRGELSRIVQFQMHDPRLGFLTITGVHVSADLRHARVFISILESDQQMEETLKALQGARGYLRTELSRSLPLRHVPDLSFRRDDSSQKGARIERLLKGEQSPDKDNDQTLPTD
ncbi:MAG: 30S ribosome-binding factor RbfA [Acidobacteriota bacterium]